MALTLVATPGAGNANTFVDLATAEAYHETLPTTAISAWTAATDGNKGAALVMATRIFGYSVMWKGRAATTTQSLPFPRTGLYDLEGNALSSALIPVWMEHATSEFSRVLLETNTTATSDLGQFQSLGLGPINIVPAQEQPTIPNNVRYLIQHWVERYNDPKRARQVLMVRA